jgi:hypothetical protein
MTPDLTNLDAKSATELVRQLLEQLRDARTAVEESKRRAIGIRKVIDGLVEMFPAAEDVLPDDFDDGKPPRPRGAEAVLRVIAEKPGSWYTVTAVVRMLHERGWMPESANPGNAVRSALERLVETNMALKGRSTEGVVIYTSTPPEDEGLF